MAAAARGVRVRLLLAGRSDVPLARLASRSLHRQLLGAGVEIHEWGHSVLHAKLAAIDDQLLLVGSFNLDPFSLVNLEVLVEVADAKAIRQGAAWIQRHLELAPPVTAVTANARWQRWLLEPLGRLVVRAAAALGRLVTIRRRRRPRTGPARRRPGSSRSA